MGYEIFAHHAHVFPREVREDGTVDALLRTMDVCGIGKAVCFAPFPAQLAPGSTEANAWLARSIAASDRLIGFGVIDFEKDDLCDQVDRIAELGLRGIKLHPAFQHFAVDSDAAFEVYARAEELGLFLSFHTGVHWHRIRDYQVWRFDEVAYHFRRLRFSMEHLGGYCFFHEGLAVMLNNMHRGEEPRIYAGLTSVFDPDANRAWNLSDQRIYDLIWQTGDRASIFGLDFPYNDAGKIKEAIDHLAGLELPEESKQRIFGGNLCRILGISREGD